MGHKISSNRCSLCLKELKKHEERYSVKVKEEGKFISDKCFYKVCKKCEHSMNWNNCPGFKRINECFQKHNVDFAFEKPKLG